MTPSSGQEAGGQLFEAPAREVPRLAYSDLSPEVETQLEQSAAFAQLRRCLSSWVGLKKALPHAVRLRLAEGQAQDPNSPETWGSRSVAARVVLRRHGLAKVSISELSDVAHAALIAGQAEADREAGIDWSQVPAAEDMAAALRRAHAALPIDLHQPAMWFSPAHQRAALGRRLGLEESEARDISRWAIAHPDEFDPEALRGWVIGSRRWLGLAAEQLAPVDYVDRPIGLFLAPEAKGRGWTLVPSLSGEMIRLVGQLGGQVHRELGGAVIPASSIPDLLDAVNHEALHAGPRELIDSRTQLAAELGRYGVRVRRPSLSDPRDRWGRLVVTKWGGDLGLRVASAAGFSSRFARRRVGARPFDGATGVQLSAAQEIGEAVEVAVERELPLLLSGEAAALLEGRVRVGRMKGRPGQLAFTRADGLSARTERLVVEQALPRLRALRDEQETVVLDGGARQVVRMALARPLEDDPVLYPPQRSVAAQMVVGSGLNASQTGTGKTTMTARSLFHRSSRTARMRALLVAEGRLLAQWREELAVGTPGRLPALVPNARVEILVEGVPLAAQLRRLEREAGERPLVVLCSNGLLDRFASELCVLRWHVVVADEALRYANPATEAHQALRQVRFGAAADCWLLTATPKGKSAEQIDVLVGLAVGDEAMITERLATREAGALIEEVNAHRLRVAYGPHLVRVTRKEMQAYMPDVRPAKPIGMEPDGALSELLEAIRAGGAEAYRELLEALRALKTLEQGSELYKEALAEMSRAQAAVLSNVGVFVDASVDPETLTQSKAALAQALVSQGLVAEAVRGGGDGQPLLRGAVAQTLAQVVEEDQVIVFAERVRCLHQLARTLRELHGVDARVGDGSVSSADFEALKRAFQAGEFPVLCLGPVGREGHNLQVASVLCHLDLPWTQDRLEQRVGRSARPGSRRDYVETYIPYVRGGGIPHVVSILSERGAEHHNILDSFEGVSAKESTVASQLGEITAQVAEAREQEGFALTAARLRVAAAVFGT